MSDYTTRTRYRGCRKINDGEIVFCGTDLHAAAMAAKHINAPNSVIILKPGRSTPARGDSHGRGDPGSCSAPSNSGLADFCPLQNPTTGRHVVGIRAAQIDKYGNLNSTAIGDYFHPTVRFPAAAVPAMWPPSWNAASFSCSTSAESSSDRWTI
jgi:glutaconate CoA-transferase subunit B